MTASETSPAAVGATTNIGRRLMILRLLLDEEADTGRGLGVVSVAERLDREKTQISRGLRSLVDSELADRDDATLEFLAGARVLRWAGHAGDQRLLATARPALRELAAQLGERVHVSVLAGTESLTVETTSADAALQTVGWVGRRVPVYCTSSGRALLMDHELDDLTALLGRAPLPPAGPNAPSTVAELASRIAASRSRGAAEVASEFEDGLTAVGVPVRDATGAIVAAVNVSGPSFRLAPRLDEATEACVSTVAGITRALAGAVTPPPASS